MLAQEDGSASTAIATVAFGSGTVAVGSGSKQGKQSEPKLNQCDLLLLKTLLSEKACEALSQEKLYCSWKGAGCCLCRA